MTILIEVERHLELTGTSPTVFGRHVCDDPGLVRDMRFGRKIGEAMAEKLRQAMADFPEGFVDSTTPPPTYDPAARTPPASDNAQVNARRAAESGSRALLVAILRSAARRHIRPHGLSEERMRHLCRDHDILIPPIPERDHAPATRRNAHV